MKLNLTILILLVVVVCSNANSQTKISKSEPDKNSIPKWVKMMDDSTSNYFEAIKNFEDYWKGKERPAEADENEFSGMSRHEKREHRKFEKELQNMTSAERNEYEAICYQYKRFSNWMNEVKPIVQPNGHVLTFYEQQIIWEKQQAEIRQQR